jgi:hypothetical protein
VGKYGHVRPRDAIEYLLDRYEEDGREASAAGTDGETTARAGGDEEETGDDDASGEEDAVLNEMMNLLDTHDDKWGEASGDERYAVELPDGSTETARTKDDVKALLFDHYR